MADQHGTLTHAWEMVETGSGGAAFPKACLSSSATRPLGVADSVPKVCSFDRDVTSSSLWCEV